MIWSPAEVVEVCEELKRLGLKPRFEEGDRIARGFADLGSEEFVILPSSRMMSLFTGQVTALQDDHRDFFLFVPSLDQCGEMLTRLGFVGIKIETMHARTWRAEGRKDDGILFAAEGESALEALLRLLVLTYREAR